MTDINLLKKVLEVQTYTKEEANMRDFIVDYADNTLGRRVFHDKTHGNVYVLSNEELDYHPCVVSHTDSVHRLKEGVVVHEHFSGLLTAHDSNGIRTGLGGDDKSGVYICLELLKKHPEVVGAFFMGEEKFCLGSQKANVDFFSKVGWAMEYDSPEGIISTYTCNGRRLFDPSSEFGRVTVSVLDSYGVTDWQDHPYTDVFMLRDKFDFCCLNLPAGYYNMHSPEEFVLVDDVSRSLSLGSTLVEGLGSRYYGLTKEEEDKVDDTLFRENNVRPLTVCDPIRKLISTISKAHRKNEGLALSTH